MYTLTLTASERKAIDWVGYRYPCGDDLYKLLIKSDWGSDEIDSWDYPGDITFNIRESIAWEIKDLLEPTDSITCFCDDLVEKIRKFMTQIV